MNFTKKQLMWAVITFVVYAVIINWQVALLLTIGVGFHEYSHLWAARRMGLQTRGFYLVPFMGGVAFVADRYKTYAQQAFVVLAGPVGGGLLAFVTAGAYYITGIPFLAAGAAWMCYLNIFNLYPLSFLDGGQLMDTITYSINRTLGVVLHTISTVVAAILLLKIAPILGVLIVVFGGSSVWSEWKNWKAWKSGNDFLLSDKWLDPPRKMKFAQAALTVGVWFLAMILLGALTLHLRHNPEADLSSLMK